MSQLIALIIAIALGAIVTAIGYVFLGDAFTQNAERGVALQFVNQASQMEMSMTAYRADKASSAHATGESFAQTTTKLVDADFLKDALVAPQGIYSALDNTTEGDVFLLVNNDGTDSLISSAVCTEINKVSNGTSEIRTSVDVTTGALAKTALAGARFGCFSTDGAAAPYQIVYEVE
jgi:hypothetical protein